MSATMRILPIPRRPDARMVADALHQSVHDDLTGLPNRALFVDRVGHALEGAIGFDTVPERLRG